MLTPFIDYLVQSVDDKTLTVEDIAYMLDDTPAHVQQALDLRRDSFKE